MKKKGWFLLGMLGALLALGGVAQAYHVEFIYGPDANYAYTKTEHYNSKFDIEDDEQDQTKGNSSEALAEKISAIAHAFARPMGQPDPIAEVQCLVNDKTNWYSFAYGYADTFGQFLILKDPGDNCDQVPTKFEFKVLGELDLHSGATTTYSYSLKFEGEELYRKKSGYDTGDSHTDSFAITKLLDVGTAYTFQVILDADLDHTQKTNNSAKYEVFLTLEPSCVPVPGSLMLLVSGLAGLAAWRGRRLW